MIGDIPIPAWKSNMTSAEKEVYWAQIKELSDILLARLQVLPFDRRGHWSNIPEEGKYGFREHYLPTMLGPELSRIVMSAERNPDALAWLRGGTLAEPEVVGGPNGYPCTFCHTHRENHEGMMIWTDGERMWVNAPCPNPDGIPYTEFTLAVPSGRIVVANDLREVFGEADEDRFRFEINQIIGQHEKTLWFAQRGLAHGFVGNSSPSLYRWAGHKDSYLLCRPPYDWDCDLEPGEEHRPFEGAGKPLARVHTQLWWYSICDYADYCRRAPDPLKEEPDYFGPRVVKVRKGTYRFRHYHERSPLDLDGPGERGNAVYFAIIERVG